MMHESLPAKLQVLRARQGLTLIEAAEKIGIGRDTLSDLERGNRHPVMPTLAKIAKGYGVPVEDLLEQPVPLAEASETGPPQVSKEELAKQGITATDAEVNEVNYNLADLWRVVRGGQPVAYFRDDDVNIRRVGMLIDLVLDTPSIVTPEAAGVVRQGMREKLKTG